jgi:hypothetical protein
LTALPIWRASAAISLNPEPVGLCAPLGCLLALLGLQRGSKGRREHCEGALTQRELHLNLGF